MGEEDAEHGGLNGIESGVRSDELERLLVARAVEAEHPHALCVVVVQACDESAVTERKEVLRREEAEGRADTRLSDALGAERLGCVLDQWEPQRRELVERGWATEEVHRHDRLRPRRDPRSDILGIEVQRAGVDVGEDRRRADACDRLRRRVERERWADRPRLRVRSLAPRARGRARRCRSLRRSRAERRETRRLHARTPPPLGRR